MYLDYTSSANIVQQLFGNMQTVPLATIFGPRLNEELTDFSDVSDIIVPTELTRPLVLLNLMNHLTRVLLPQLGLEDVDCSVVHFFLKNKCDYLIESVKAYMNGNQVHKRQRILGHLSVLFNVLYVIYSYDNVYEFADLMEHYDTVCELMSIPEELSWLAKLWRYFGNSI